MTKVGDEQIIACNLSDPKVQFPMDRSEFYKEQIDVYRKTGKPSKAVSVVNVLTFDCKGEIFIQKRSKTKNHNPRLLDKSMGGHIKHGDTPDYTVMVETVQELQVPSIVVRNDKHFVKTYQLLFEYLDSIAVIKKIDSGILKLSKIINGEKVVVATLNHLYFGAYNGSVKTVDREAKGVLLYTIEDLEDEIKDAPSMFTDDLKYYLKNYKKQVASFVEYIEKNSK